MHKYHLYKHVLLTLLITIMCLFSSSTLSLAAENYISFTPLYTNETTGYTIYLDDWADLLSETEEQQLLAMMKPISQYGHVAFVSIAENPFYNSETYAEHYYSDHFSSNTSGTLFLIDMEEHYLWIYSNGEIYKTVTTAYSNTITDNIYPYAFDGDYYTCAATAYEQIHTLLEGKPIAQPMKYISNALLAIVIALLLNFFLAMLLSRSGKASSRQVMDSIYTKVDINNPTQHFLHQTRTYSPQNSGAGGKGGRSGGGGGSRGGGGGHRF